MNCYLRFYWILEDIQISCGGSTGIDPPLGLTQCLKSNVIVISGTDDHPLDQPVFVPTIPRKLVDCIPPDLPMHGLQRVEDDLVGEAVLGTPYT